MWVNGHLIVEDMGTRGLVVGAIRQTVSLKQGNNLVLLKMGSVREVPHFSLSVALAGKVVSLPAVDEQGFIRRWWFLGPFNNRYVEGRWVGIDDPMPAEQTVNLGAAYTGKEGRLLGWKRETSPTSFIDLSKQLEAYDGAVAYAYTHLMVPQSGDYLVKIGSDDGFRLWIDSKLVGRIPIQSRGCSADSDMIPLHLDAGLHPILLKVDQWGGGWGFMMRITRADGTPVPVKIID
jgi:hypothetical protein